MCGIAGVTNHPGVTSEIVERMSMMLAHRGPDDQGSWVDVEAGVGFGHRRLSILDLSAAGHQPMLSPTGRLVLAFNGEIYNHRELRAELSDHAQAAGWRGHSDTETLLAAFDYWGVRPTLERAKGMFALALWDRSNRVLTLARDRLGEKPLYYGRIRGESGPFCFSSELKALRGHPDFDAPVDRNALALMMRYLAVPAPFSIYRGVFKLLPGTMLTLGPGDQIPTVTTYWSGAEVAREGAANPLDLNDQSATDELECMLEAAVGRQLIADVPLGAFLSGGLDSSTIVAIMQKLSNRPVKTFTIGFDAAAFDEAVHAKAVARHLGTDHAELYVTPREAMTVIPKLPTIYDEPFADSSQIPTYLVSALARTQVAVALSGDGGDELFGGYPRYGLTDRLWRSLARIPNPLRAPIAKALLSVPRSAWDALSSMARPFTPAAMQFSMLGEKVHRSAPLLRSATFNQLYDAIISQWRNASEAVIGAPPDGADVSLAAPCLEGLGRMERMMAHDMLHYLPDDILVKVDRAAMALSLETRVPFLDSELVEFAWKLPLRLKVREGKPKWLLREVLYRHVPRELIERPKMGFGVPIGSWLRGPLREWAHSLLDERRLREEGYFSPAIVRAEWAAHLRGDSNNGQRIWTVLMFQAWLDASANPPLRPATS